MSQESINRGTTKFYVVIDEENEIVERSKGSSAGELGLLVAKYMAMPVYICAVMYMSHKR